jgi:drug/metabolite transporter (DMT)-like permease
MANLNVALKVRVALTLVGCGVLGGANFLFVKALAEHISPLQLVAARILLAGIVLTAVLALFRAFPPLTARLFKGAGVLAFIDAIIPYLLIAWAAPHIQASVSALLVSTMPLFTAVMVTAVDKRRVAGETVVGLLCGAGGVALLAGPKAVDFGSSETLAIFAVLLAAASYASAAVFMRGVLQDADPIGLSAVKFLIAAVIVVPILTVSEGVDGYSQLDTEGWLSLLALGALVTGLARCGYVWVVGTAGSVSASLLTYVVPAAALVLGYVFVNEPVTWLKMSGALMVACSITSVLFGREIVSSFRGLALKSFNRLPDARIGHPTDERTPSPDS